MLGQAHWPTRRLLAAAALALAVLAIPALGVADSGRSTPSLRAQAAALAAKARSATLGLYALDAAARDRREPGCSRSAAQAAALRARRISLARQLAIARRSATIAQQHLGSHVRALYERGDVSTLEVVFGARSLDDALTSIDDLNRMATPGRGGPERRQGDAGAALPGGREPRRAGRRARRPPPALPLQPPPRSRARGPSGAPTSSSLSRQRKLTLAQIAAVVARAKAAQARTAAIMRAVDAKAAAAKSGSGQGRRRRRRDTAPPTVPLTPPTSPVAAAPGERVLTVTATGYAIRGRTATGLPTGWGIAAVDPTVIPLGTHMTVPGYGDAVAADIGSGIVGASIDLWFPTVAQANAWGRRTVTIVLH